ncbi:MAG: APC family permease [Deltaproteobacteria bacterium]|nr:APC family permease [Deltaproteobacteria bacterium]
MRNKRPQAPTVLPSELIRGTSSRKRRLGQWLATAICGNDITSSCLYVAAIASVYAGVLAPIVLLLVGGVLYLYKKVYTEVVEALPLNGGAYNCLLNSTSKLTASMAACMTILSYIATAVISAKTAVEYFHHLVPIFPIIPTTIGILALFAVLNIIGITESAVVALLIFIFHMATLVTFCLVGFAHLPGHLSVAKANLMTMPHGNALLMAVFLGFSAALLGVSGFESSANFVEEQQPGVFRKTLRNMLIAVVIFNPLTSILSLCLLPLEDIISHQGYLLAHVAGNTGGEFLADMVIVDAAAVLSGAVLTSFVGVTGLVRRMALDQGVPRFLLRSNRLGTHHRIIIVFFLLCSSILLVTGGRLLNLAGVYTLSFLGVMTLFAFGNILLKIKRKELKRTYRAGWLTVIAAMGATSLGILGNMIIDYHNVIFFLEYFIPTVLIVIIMYLRIPIMKVILNFANALMTKILRFRTSVIDKITEITNQRVILFTRGGRLDRLKEAFHYILKNESSRIVVLVHLYDRSENNEEKAIREALIPLKNVFPSLKVYFVARQGRFGPEMVDALSKEYGVMKNSMFIGAPEDKHNFSMEQLGDVRIIF